MGKFQAMRKCLFVFLALVAFHGSHLTHGRKIIKPLNTNSAMQKDYPQATTLAPLKTSLNIPTPSSKKVDTPIMTSNNGDALSFVDSGADTNAFRPTTPGSSPGVGHKKFAAEDMKEMNVVQSPDVEASLSGGSKNDFKPTKPGHSPGVGHKKFAAEDMKEMNVVQSPDVEVSLSGGSKNDFKPTKPGHSPGVGHAYLNKNGQLN